MLGSTLLAFITVVAACDASNAQGLTSPLESAQRPIVGASRGIRPPGQPPLLDDHETTRKKVHRDPYGKSCVDVYGYSRPQIVNPKMFNQTVMAENHCSQLIKLTVCYYGSHSCVPVEVPPYGKREALLGFFPTQAEFRYEYLEQF